LSLGCTHRVTSSGISFPLPSMSNDDQDEGRWKQFVGKAQEVYGDLTDDWSDQFNGNITQAIGWLQEEYGDAKEELSEFLNGEKEDDEEDEL